MQIPESIIEFGITNGGDVIMNDYLRALNWQYPVRKVLSDLQTSLIYCQDEALHRLTSGTFVNRQTRRQLAEVLYEAASSGEWHGVIPHHPNGFFTRRNGLLIPFAYDNARFIIPTQKFIEHCMKRVR